MLRLRDGVATEVVDQLAVEGPLTIRVNGVDTATTMRTPGHDIELALGWLISEGVVHQPSDLVGAIACDENTVEVRLDASIEPPAPRLTMTSSACGICGADSISEVVARRGPDPADDPIVVSPRVISKLPDQLRTAQSAFDRTGGLHAAGLFTVDGDPVCIREDVGRHNAVDKVIGWALQHEKLPASRWLLQVSARASFELTQKAVMAGIPLLAAVSAPSTLAVDLAREAGITLIGFSRNDSFNCYACSDRIMLAAADGPRVAQPH